MSDLETTSSRGQATVPISAAAIGKLRALGGQSPAFAQADAFVDVFAEVFARIAVAKPVRGQDQESNTQSRAPASDKTPTEPRQRDRELSSETDADVQNFVETKANTQDGDQNAHQKDVSAAVENGERVDADQINVSVVEVRQADNKIDETEAPEVIKVVAYDDSGHRRRDRRDSASAEPVEIAEHGRWGGDRRNPNTEQIQGPTDEIGAQDSLSFEPASDSGDAESSRRFRGRRDRGGEENTQPNASVGGARSAQRPSSVTYAAANGESNASQPGPADAAPTTPAARSAESTVTNLQSVVTNAVRSAANGAQTATQTTTRGSIQAIESRTSLRDASRNRPDSPPPKSNTAETISRVKLIQRVSKAFQHLGPDGGTVRLRLAPAEMGSVRIEMRIHQRKIQARVVAESEAAGAALREHLPELRQRLESQGMQVERLEIESGDSDSEFGSHTGRRGRGDSSNPDQQWRDGQRASAAGRGPASVSQSVSQPEHSQARPETLTPNIGVDVRL
jgi:flagellar hook-length control protein FliK